MGIVQEWKRDPQDNAKKESVPFGDKICREKG